jgi:PAS domain S-box-containing protein
MTAARRTPPLPDTPAAEAPALDTPSADAAYAAARRAVESPSRLGALHATGLLDSEVEEVFDRLTRLAVRLVRIPAAFISLVDEHRDFYKSACGFGEPLASARELGGPTFCHYAVQSREPLVIPDTAAHPVYREIPTVRSLGVAAYVGVPLVVQGETIGSFCAIDARPRAWSAEDLEVLTELAASAQREIELRVMLRTAQQSAERFREQAEELASANHRLEEQAVELEMTNQQLQEQAAELEMQAEELHVTAAHLEREFDRAEQLRASADLEHRRLAAVLDQLPLGVHVAEAPSGRLVMGNAAVGAIWGTANASDSVDRYSVDYVGYHRGTRRRYGNHEWPLARALQHGEIVSDEIIEVERPDGSRRVVSVSASPVHDSAGGVLGGVATSIDVTDREALVAALAASERQVRTIAENATLALFVMDARQHCVYLNPAAERLTGFTLAELQGGPLHDFVHHTHPDGRPYPLAECPIDRALPQNEREQGTETFVHRDGSFYPVAFTASPLRDEVTGAPVGTIIEVRGIAAELAAAAERERLLVAEREARAEAETANRAKSQFLANMSHELRTPLNAIGGYTELLTLGLHGPVSADQRQALSRIQSAQRRLLALINDVLNYAKLEGGRVEYDLAPLDARAVIADVVPLVEPQIHTKGIALEVRLPDAPCLVLADRAKLGQVLLNLLSNATKFTSARNPVTREPGRITIEVDAVPAADGQPRRPILHLSVSDTGEGIPREKLDSIFEPFVQVHADYTRVTEGTGLGLAISRDLARGMGGDLCVHSTEGEGSTFTIILQRAAATEESGR